MTAFYNEIEPYAAQWLRNLIEGGHIAPGVVDERDIRDITPAELRGFKQVHFFAGIGVWSLALRNAGFPDDREVWTGSCPCQPFSKAGRGAGMSDERHLWPHMHYLITQCKPPVIFGEQVASNDAEPWLQLVQDDLEALGYATGAVAFPAAGIGAPHIRDRTYWIGRLGDTDDQGLEGLRLRHSPTGGSAPPVRPIATPGEPSGMEHSSSSALQGYTRGWTSLGPENASVLCGMAYTERHGPHRTAGDETQQSRHRTPNGLSVGGSEGLWGTGTGPTNGHWRAADWLRCRDGKWRPVEPGTRPLAHGTPSRVGRLRAYGNAIVAPQAQTFIEAAYDYH